MVTDEIFFGDKWSGTINWSPSSYKGETKWFFTDVTFTGNFGYLEAGKKKITLAKYDWERKKEFEIGNDLIYSFK